MCSAPLIPGHGVRKERHRQTGILKSCLKTSGGDVCGESMSWKRMGSLQLMVRCLDYFVRGTSIG